MVAEDDQSAVGHRVLLEHVDGRLHRGLGVLRVAGRLAEGRQGAQQVLGAVELRLHDRPRRAAESRGHRGDRGGRPEALAVQIAREHRGLRRPVDVTAVGYDGIAEAAGSGQELVGRDLIPGENLFSDPVRADAPPGRAAVDVGGGSLGLRHGAGGDEGDLVAGTRKFGPRELCLVGDQADAGEHRVFFGVVWA